MKIHITEEAELELKRLGFDVANAIQKTLKYVPSKDIAKIDKILIADISTSSNVAALYVPKHKEYPARIELYLKRLFSHIKHEESFKLMLAIQEVGLAQAIFHEIGHHVRRTLSHGIKKAKSEKYANLYATNALDRYILDNAQLINSCYDSLIENAAEKNLDINVINNMRSGWMRHYEKAVKRSKKS
ncbi:MAG: hypothetical protein MI892_11235 [Desulfobacterales bacterium]|nr:hypothetical protein [Desulfobacterales bacterium]